MIERVFCGAIVVAVLALGAPVWAETPMTPSRPMAAAAPSGTARQWVEPPAAAGSPAAQPDRLARQTRTSRQGQRTYAQHHGRMASPSDHMARQLNRQALHGVWYGGGMPYFRGYGPPPYSESGD